MLKVRTLRDRTVDAITATLAAHRKARRRTTDPVITSGVACYYDGMSGFLLVVPLDKEVQTPLPLPQGTSGVGAPPSV